MKSSQTKLFILLVALTGHSLYAQQVVQRSAAELLEIEQASKTTPIPGIPRDESRPEALPLAPEIRAGSNDANLLLSSGEAEKRAAQMGPQRHIPDSPSDERPGQTAPGPQMNPQVSPESNTVNPVLLSNPDEMERQQLIQSVRRTIPDPPKSDSKSN